jgi:RNA polymerase sigma-70 factor (ECF subfamily)
MTTMDPPAALATEPPPDTPGDDWIVRLTTPGMDREVAIGQLHALMSRAARHQVSRMPEAIGLGEVRRAEVVHAAADEATVSVLGRLSTFEGRSRFTTWAYKFGILHAAVEVRRTAWRSREIDLYSVPEPVSDAVSPEAFVEASNLAATVRRGITEALTPHQRRVVLALLVHDVPIDVLADRLGSSRTALYKTVHDARQRLRRYLADEGVVGGAVEEVQG